MKTKYTEQQIEKLNNLPPCKNCGGKVDTKKLTFLTTGLNLNHACGDDSSTIVSLQGSFDYVVGAWLAVNGGLLNEIFEDIKKGASAADKLHTKPKTERQRRYERGWQHSLQQLANIMTAKYGGGD